MVGFLFQGRLVLFAPNLQSPDSKKGINLTLREVKYLLEDGKGARTNAFVQF